jgi:hypothetical protein
LRKDGFKERPSIPTGWKNNIKGLPLKVQALLGEPLSTTNLSSQNNFIFTRNKAVYLMVLYYYNIINCKINS